MGPVTFCSCQRTTLQAEVLLQRLAVVAHCLRERIRAKLEATFHGIEIEYGVADGLSPVFFVAVFFRDCH